MAVGNKVAESQGLSYVPNDYYLQDDFKGSEPLDFSNISSSGIMSQYPYIYPPVNQGGGDGGESIIDPGPQDYGYKSSYASIGTTPGENDNYLKDIGEGTIDEEDIKNNRPGFFSTVGKIGGLLSNPLGTMAYGAYRNYAQKKENEQRRQEAQQLQDQLAVADREITANNYRNYGSGAADGSGGYNEGDGGSYSGASTEDYGGGEKDGGFIDGTNRRPFNSGGRAGYFFGGRVSFKNGGLASIL